MHWDWPTFAAGVVAGFFGSLVPAGIGFWAFIRGMSDI